MFAFHMYRFSCIIIIILRNSIENNTSISEISGKFNARNSLLFKDSTVRHMCIILLVAEILCLQLY